MQIKFKKLHPNAQIPTRGHYNDAGVDLYTLSNFELEPGERKSIPLGLALEIPDGYVGLIWDKSGLSHKYGIKTFGGVVDAGYRGEIHAGIMNLSDKFFRFEKGQKIVQLIIQKIESVSFIEADELNITERGSGNFGSTGK